MVTVELRSSSSLSHSVVMSSGTRGGRDWGGSLALQSLSKAISSLFLSLVFSTIHALNTNSHIVVCEPWSVHNHGFGCWSPLVGREIDFRYRSLSQLGFPSSSKSAHSKKV